MRQIIAHKVKQVGFLTKIMITMAMVAEILMKI